MNESPASNSIPPPVAWRSATWTPLLMVPAYGVATVLLNPTGRSADAKWPVLVFGGMLCMPLLCAIWAAWSPFALIQRLPSAAAACALLAITACAGDGDPMFLFAYAALFLLFSSALAILRHFGGWRLSVNVGEDAGNVEHANRFSIRHLLAATTVVAVLISLGKFVSYGQTEVASDSAWIVIGRVLTIAGIYGTVMLPTVGVGMIVLGKGKRLWIESLAAVVGLALSSLAAALTLVWIEPSLTGGRDPFSHLWLQMAMFASGGALTMFISALALRLAGYRITRRAPDA